jgi:HTH-type transcriptional regulator/antitoxin HigA
MSNEQTYFPSKPIHPGVSLAEDLAFLSLSVTEAAERMGVSKKHLSNIINGKASITPEVALKLEKVTGTEAAFWNKLTRNYQASLAVIEEKKRLVGEIKNVKNSFKETYQELAKKNILPKLNWVEKNFEDITRELLSFFAVSSLDYIGDTRLAAFRRHNQNVNENTVAAIIRLGERKAQSVDVEPFNQQALKAALPEIKSYSLEEPSVYLPKLEEKLRTLGIVLVCVPGFAHTGLQGAAKWLSADKAMIILRSETQRGTEITEDKFWFNLFHQIGHLILHGKGEGFIDLDDATDSEEEKEANRFASQQFMPKFDALTDLNEYKQNGSIRADLAIPGLANRYGIAPSIVAGMMSYEYQDKQGNVYSVLNSYKRKISHTNYQV